MAIEFDAILEASSVKKEDFQIFLSDMTGSYWYPLLYDPEGDDRQSCVESYVLEGGPESPFETLTLTLSKKKLSAQYPSLYQSLKPGLNRIILNAVGRSNMTMVKMKLRKDTLTLTAYGDAEILKGTSLFMDGVMMPYDWIKDILTSGQYGVQFAEGKSFLTSMVYATDTSDQTDLLYFQEGTNVWYVLQVCAMYMKCKIFFCDNKAFLIDYTQDFGSMHDGILFDYGPIDVRDRSTSNPMFGRLTGDVEMGDEGMDTVINRQDAKCSSTFQELRNDISASSGDFDASVSRYGSRAGQMLYLSNLVQTPSGQDPEPNIIYNQASTFLHNFVEYRCEPQQSVSLSVKEMSKDDNGEIIWTPCFQMCSRVESISDDVNGIYVDNTSVLTPYGPKGNLLNMSSYQRSYPEGTTKYIFGIMANIDLSESTSTIVTQLGNAGQQNS